MRAVWVCGRVVECTGLENRRAEKHREFESHRTRQSPLPTKGAKLIGLFICSPSGTPVSISALVSRAVQLIGNMAQNPLVLSKPNAESAPPLGEQLIAVIASGWNGAVGTLQRFERAGVDCDWQRFGAPVFVSLGRSGLAWGRGLHANSGRDGPMKREGDGCSPAGVFSLIALFGNAAQDSPFARAARLPYLSATSDLKAIEDPASVHYNRIVDQSAVERPDWASCEDMLRDDQRYAIGVVVGHNAEPTMPGAGSCIFLHVWAGEGVPTAGCTAMALDDMRAIAGWLDGAAAPVLVQLPQAEYERWRKDWGLPVFLPDA